ncbi:MAG: hypothetical protein IJF45_05380 [Clostridia bacterium]|nr:hypothetical protein [Clostridia bacterium]
MTAVIFIFALSVLAMLLLVFLKPAVHVGQVAISIFWVAPVCGVLALVIGGRLSLSEIAAGLIAPGAVNPIQILVLFFSMTLLSVFLDEAGFFRYLAGGIMRRAGTGQVKLFVSLYLVVSVLTVFTSNDIIVLTFTPFICYFAKNAKIDPLPYLFCEFVSANTWSMMLIIGNPTNIYLAVSNGVDFAAYTAQMLLPTVLAGSASFAMLWLLFRKKLSAPIGGNAPDTLPMDTPAVWIGSVALGACVIFLVLSSHLSLPMWLIAAAFCAGLYLVAIIMQLARRRGVRLITRSLLRAPLDIIPFVLSMFVLVLALEKVEATALFAKWLVGGGEVLRFGVASFLASNVLNNIPMSVLFASIVGAGGASASALYACVIGSNIGAFLTPMGALAGIMWIAMLKDQEISLSFGKFTLLGAAISVPTLLAALLGLVI